jgi:hypothetical protein
MNNLKKIALASVLALSSVAANAELISTDLLVDGDSRATLDTVSGLEWLDSIYTLGKSVTDVQMLLETTYEGWRLPTSDEVKTLFTNNLSYVNSDDVNYDIWIKSSINLQESESFVSKMGWTTHTESVHSRESLFVNNGSVWRANVTSQPLSGYSNAFLGNYTNDLNIKQYNLSIFLVSDGGTTLSSINDPTLNINNANAPINNASVPIPATLGLLGLAMTGMSFRRK